jgi:hypothetical protein
MANVVFRQLYSHRLRRQPELRDKEPLSRSGAALQTMADENAAFFPI